MVADTTYPRLAAAHADGDVAPGQKPGRTNWPSGMAKNIAVESKRPPAPITNVALRSASAGCSFIGVNDANRTAPGAGWSAPSASEYVRRRWDI